MITRIKKNMSKNLKTWDYEPYEGDLDILVNISENFVEENDLPE